MKIRFHRGDWRDDIEALRPCAQAVGDKLTLMVDCNQGWRMPWDTDQPWSAQGRARRSPANWSGSASIGWRSRCIAATTTAWRRCAETTDMRIAGGEMTRELYEFRTLIERGCLDVLQPDAALVGGITGLRKVGQMALEHNLVFTPHTWTNGMGVMANAQLVCGATGRALPRVPL